MRYFVEPTGKKRKYPCGICTKVVTQRHKAIQCDSCNYGIISNTTESTIERAYEALKKPGESEKYFRKICKEDIIPFQKLSYDEFFTSVVKTIDIEEDLNLRISPSQTLKTLFNDLSSQNEDKPSPINCGYYDLLTHIP